MKRFIRDDCERDLAKLLANCTVVVGVGVVLNLISIGISIGISTSDEIVVLPGASDAPSRTVSAGSIVDEDDEVDGEPDDGNDESSFFVSSPMPLLLRHVTTLPTEPGGVSFIASM